MYNYYIFTSPEHLQQTLFLLKNQGINAAALCGGIIIPDISYKVFNIIREDILSKGYPLIRVVRKKVGEEEEIPLDNSSIL